MSHFFAPPVDLGIPLLGFAFLGATAIVLLAVVILLEALIYRRVIPGGHWFRDSLVVNIASAALGIPFLWTAFPSYPGPQLYAVLAATWLLSVGIEGVLLRLLRRRTRWGRLFAASVAANLVSYFVLAAVMAAFLASQ